MAKLFLTYQYQTNARFFQSAMTLKRLVVKTICNNINVLCRWRYMNNCNETLLLCQYIRKENQVISKVPLLNESNVLQNVITFKALVAEKKLLIKLMFFIDGAIRIFYKAL